MDKISTHYIVDLSNISTLHELHTAFCKAMNFPDWYGFNLDALWDCLTDLYGDRIHIELIGFETAMEHLGKDTRETLLELLHDLKHSCFDRYAEDIRIDLIDGAQRTEID